MLKERDTCVVDASFLLSDQLVLHQISELKFGFIFYIIWYSLVFILFVFVYFLKMVASMSILLLQTAFTVLVHLAWVASRIGLILCEIF